MTAIPYGGVTEWIGNLEVVPVFDGYSHEDPAQFYLIHEDAVPELGHRREDWLPFSDLLDEGGMIEHGLGGFLVRTGDHLVLIDTGVGPEQIGPYGPFDRVIRGGELPKNLGAVGVDPKDITDIVLTHLHPDHYGWATSGGIGLFPNATIRCHALDWDHFVVKPGDALSPHSAGLLVLADRLECWDHDGPLLPGIDVLHAPGHTPGSTILVLSSGDERGVLLGDVVHCPVELVDAEWASLGDVDVALARRTKERFAREFEGTGIPMAGAHFPGMRFGRLLPAAGRRRWVV